MGQVISKALLSRITENIFKSLELFHANYSWSKSSQRPAPVYKQCSSLNTKIQIPKKKNGWAILLLVWWISLIKFIHVTENDGKIMFFLRFKWNKLDEVLTNIVVKMTGVGMAGEFQKLRIKNKILCLVVWFPKILISNC